MVRAVISTGSTSLMLVILLLFLSVLSSGSREILFSRQSGVEHRETKHRLGQTDGRGGSKSTPAGRYRLLLHIMGYCLLLSFSEADYGAHKKSVQALSDVWFV